VTRKDPKTLLAGAAEALYLAANRTPGGEEAKRLRMDARLKLARAMEKLEAGEPYVAPKTPAEVIREELDFIRSMSSVGSIYHDRTTNALAALDKLEAGE